MIERWARNFRGTHRNLQSQWGNKKTNRQWQKIVKWENEWPEPVKHSEIRGGPTVTTGKLSWTRWGLRCAQICVMQSRILNRAPPSSFNTAPHLMTGELLFLPQISMQCLPLNLLSQGDWGDTARWGTGETCPLNPDKSQHQSASSHSESWYQV